MDTPVEDGGPPLEGRPAAQEFAELLLLRLRPAALAIGVVVVVALLLALVGVLPAGPVAGLVVGVVALLAAVAAMVAADAADPVVRGPRHVRTTGRTVVGRVGPTPDRDEIAPVTQGFVRALQQVRHLRLLVVGIGHDPALVAEALVGGVAAAGHSALLVDLTSSGPQDDAGLLAVAAGTHRLGDVARIDPELALARIGVGHGEGEPQAAAGVLAATPPSDLDLLVTVLPADETPDPRLLSRIERVLAVVPLGLLDRDDVQRRLALVEGTRSAPASVVVVDVPVPPVATDAEGDAAPLPVPTELASDADAPLPRRLDDGPDAAPDPLPADGDDTEPADDDDVGRAAATQPDVDHADDAPLDAPLDDAPAVDAAAPRGEDGAPVDGVTDTVPDARADAPADPAVPDDAVTGTTAVPEDVPGDTAVLDTDATATDDSEELALGDGEGDVTYVLDEDADGQRDGAAEAGLDETGPIALRRDEDDLRAAAALEVLAEDRGEG